MICESAYKSYCSSFKAVMNTGGWRGVWMVLCLQFKHFANPLWLWISKETSWYCCLLGGSCNLPYDLFACHCSLKQISFCNQETFLGTTFRTNVYIAENWRNLGNWPIQSEGTETVRQQREFPENPDQSETGNVMYWLSEPVNGLLTCFIFFSERSLQSSKIFY